MRLPRWLVSCGLGLVMLLLSSGLAQAQFGNCHISTTTMSFGVYDVFATAPLDTTGTIHITCFGWLRAVSVWLSKGNGPGTDRRQMIYWHPSGPIPLEYNLYLDAAHTQPWGDPLPFCYSTNARWFFLDLNLNVYGRIASEQDVPVGSYTDTITVSINF